VPGVIQRVYSKVNDKVRQGDLLAVIKDDEAYARIEAARAEVDVRVAEREEDEEPKNALLEALRAAQDELGAAERRLHSARLDFDRDFIARRDGKSTDADVDKARQRIDDAKGEILERRKAVEVAQAKEGLPLLTRLDSGLTIARSDLTLAELAFDKTRVRATADGTVLQLEATAGETATPAAPVPLAVIGNISSLEVTAEVEERDISKVWLGQDVVIRANAFAGQEFAGKVTHIAPRVGRPGLGLRSASEPRDVEVLEVDIELQGKTPLLPGMRVDVFFKPKAAMKAAAKN
ncbi:MAG: efflux RND transporter periplasmic adaptor subunit, partial [Hyphomicrobiales bacterium]|nr:efflux RND transporter periplasmic adaptor subunit [Hyphomicrobiales bacterium]